MLSDKTVPRLSIDPFSDGFLAEPYAHHALLRDAGPVFWLECYGIYGATRHAHSHRTRSRYMFALPVEPLRRWYPDKLRPTRL